MSVTSVGASTSAYSYLQSLLPAAGTNTVAAADPVSQLLAAFYPSGSGDASGTPAASSSEADTAADGTSSGGGCPPFSPDTMATLISAQGELRGNFEAAQTHFLFKQFDASGDGQISKSEFEDVFGSGSDTSKVDGLFNALDTNGDGSVAESELASAVHVSNSHHHHHMHGSGEGGGGGGVDDLLSSTDGTDATGGTATSSDGSTSPTLTGADGSTASTTMPGSTDSSAGDSGSGSSVNMLLEQLIRLQAQFLAPSAAQDLATI